MRVVIAQIRVEREVARNSETICSFLRRAVPGDWVVFPEGALTGYFPDEADYLANMGRGDVEAALERLRAVVARKGVSLSRRDGSVRSERVAQFRRAHISWPRGPVVRQEHAHRTRRAHFAAGDRLPLFEVDGVKVGIQICWELLFPRQWAQLKRDAAQVVFHLNNAVKPEDAFWEHVLLARAFENRYFVGSVNNAAAPQTLPSYLIAPSGETLLRCDPRIEQALTCELELSQGEPVWSSTAN